MHLRQAGWVAGIKGDGQLAGDIVPHGPRFRRVLHNARERPPAAGLVPLTFKTRGPAGKPLLAAASAPARLLQLEPKRRQKTTAVLAEPGHRPHGPQPPL